ncbi:MAG: RsiV family protein [Clostridia bacterium]|nr:RsiV family protein [Clostridia bacterium]MDD4387559.1 RsiV family protein [Clostridia bacterium]
MLYILKVNNIIETKNENIKETIALRTIASQDDYVLQRINEKYKNSNIEVYYPVTKYEVLNKEVKSIIDAKISKFKENIKDNVKYSMFINFDIYKYDNYIGFVFHVLEDVAAVHPNTYIFTVNYNIKNNCIINIDTLISENNNILNLMSKYAYITLSNSDKIKEINMPYMLTNGTKAIKTNFESFVFTKYGMVIFFEKYQIAPYTHGEFCITIPYLELNLNISE